MDRAFADVARYELAADGVDVSPDVVASRALAGIDRGDFYIPTQAFMLGDVKHRYDEIEAAFATLDEVIAAGG